MAEVPYGSSGAQGSGSESGPLAEDALALVPLPAVDAGAFGRGSAVDLARHYSALADDQRSCEKRREAAMLLALAESSLADPEGGELDLAETLQMGSRARLLFCELEDTAGEVHAKHLVARAEMLAAGADVIERSCKWGSPPQQEAQRLTELQAPCDAIVLAPLAVRAEEEQRLQSFLPDALASLGEGLDDDDDEGMQGKEDALDESRDDALGLAWELLEDARHHLLQEQVAEARRAGQEAVALYRQLGDRRSVAKGLRVVIRALTAAGEGEAAEELASEELERFRDREDLNGEAAMLLSLAELTTEQGPEKCAEALQMAQEALELFQALGDGRMEAYALLAVAGVRKERNEPLEAMQAACDALEIFQEIGVRKGEAVALHGVAVAYTMREDLRDALKCANMAKAIFQELGLRRHEVAELNLTAQLHRELGDLPAMLRDAEASMSAAREMASLKEEAAALALVVQARSSLGQEEEARAAAQGALQRFLEAGYDRGQALAWDLLVRCHTSKERFGEAREAAEQALAVIRKLDDRDWESTMLCTISNLELCSSRYEEADKSVHDALALMEQLGDKDGQASARLDTLVAVHCANGAWGDALGALTEAEGLYRTLGDEHGQASTLLTSCSVCRAAGDLSQAEACAVSARELSRSLGDSRLQAQAFHALSLVGLAKGEHGQAACSGHEAMLLYQKCRDGRGEASVLLHMCDVFQSELLQFAEAGGTKEARRFKELAAKAEKMATAASKMAERCRDKGMAAVAKFRSAEAHLIANRLEEALAMIEVSLKLYREVENHLGEGHALVTKSYLLWCLGRAPEAMEAGEAAMSIGQRCADRHLEALAEEHLRQLVEGPSRGAAPHGAAGVQQALEHVRQVKTAAQSPAAAAAVLAPEGGLGAAEAAAAAAAAAAPDLSAGGGGSSYAVTPSAGLDVSVVTDAIHGILLETVGVGMEADTPFMDAGLDSLMSIEFRSRVGQAFSGLDLKPTVAFDYPTARELAMHVADRSLQR